MDVVDVRTERAFVRDVTVEAAAGAPDPMLESPIGPFDSDSVEEGIRNDAKRVCYPPGCGLLQRAKKVANRVVMDFAVHQKMDMFGHVDKCKNSHRMRARCQTETLEERLADPVFPQERD